MKTISLKTLLVLLLALAFLLLAILLMAANLVHTRDFLTRQLHSHAQDTATTLALQLSPAFRTDDLATVANTVDALFDSGYYQRIALNDPNGRPILVRENEVRIEGAPDWFIRLIPLDTPAGSAEAMAGWRRAARVQVTSHPGYAYRQLWQNTRSVLVWTAALGALCALLTVWTLRRALRPLADMERLAAQVGAGRFEQIDAAHAIRELSSIGGALNRMSASVERMLNEQSTLVNKLQQDLYHDQQSGLYNRTYLVSAAEAALAEAGHTVGLAILRIGGLGELNARKGRVAGDRLVQIAAAGAAALAGEFAGVAGRLDGGQFAVLLDQVDAERLDRLAELLSQAGVRALQEVDAVDCCEAHAGAALVTDTRRAVLFASADAALRDARIGPSGSHRLAASEAPGAQELRALLLTAIEQNRFQLEWQPALRCTDMSLDHFEAYARIPTERGAALPAGTFVHLAEEGGLIATLDESIVTHAWMALDGRQHMGAINLSAASLVSPGFADWLRTLIHAPEVLQLELTLPGLLATPGALGTVGVLHQAGFRIVLDRFVPHTEALARMREICPYRVKVDGALCRQAGEDAGTRAMLKTLCDHARELGVRVGATGVERAEQRQVLCELGFDTLQGRLFGSRELR